MESVDLGQLFQQEAAASAPIEEALTAREAVRQCLPQIKKSRKQKVSWDSISTTVIAAVKQGYDIDIHLTGNTVRFYYYELTRKKDKGHHVSTRRSAQQTQKPKAKSPEREPLPSEEHKAQAPETAEPVEVPAVKEKVAQEGASPVTRRDESTQITKEASAPSQSNSYQRPPGSRFTKGYRVKHWNGGSS